MRRFTDADEREWDIVVGRESWGAFLALFVPRGRKGEARQAPLDAESHNAARVELAEMGEDELRALLERSRAKDR